MSKEVFCSQSLVPQTVQPLFPELLFLHLPIRTLGKEYSIVAGLFTTDTFDFTFITKTYKGGNSGSKRMNPKQVALRVQAKAREMGDLKPPHYRTFLWVLAPILKKQEKTRVSVAPRWRGTTLSVKTREGKDLSVDYSNRVWQCDHTRVDVLPDTPHFKM